MGSTATHNLRIVVSNIGLDQATSALNSFGKTSGGLIKSQNALNGALGKTEGAAIKLGTGLTKTGKAATTTGKQTQSLGQAFKSSSLMIAAFASSLVNTYQQVDSLMDQEMKLNRMRATLDKQTTQLQIAEANLAKKYNEGKISGEAYRLQSEKLASQRAILTVKEEQYADALQDNKTAWLSLATSVIPTVITGFASLSQVVGSLKGTFEAAGSATNVLATAKKGLQTAVTAVTTAFTPLTNAFKNILPSITDTHTAVGTTATQGLTGSLTNLGTELTKSEQHGNIFTKAFTRMGDTLKTFFGNMKTDISNATGLFDKIKAAFTSFFRQIGDGLKGLGGALKQAGTMIVNFGRQLSAAIVSHPILLAIGAISLALAALIFDLGGFRTKLNEIGVAIGKAVPFLKPFLDALGWVGQKLGELGNYLTGTQQSLEDTGKSATLAAAEFDPLIVALKRTFDLKTADQIYDIDQAMKSLRTAVTDLGSTIVPFLGDLDIGIFKNRKGFDEFKTSVDASLKSIPIHSVPVLAAVMNLYTQIDKAKTSGMEWKDAQVLLNTAIDQLSNALGAQVSQTAATVTAQQKQVGALEQLNKGMTEAEKILTGLANAEKGAETQFNEFAVAFTEGNYDIIEAMGLTAEEITALRDRFQKEFPAGAVVVEQSGQKIVKSLATINEEGKKFAEESTKLVIDLAKTLNENLPPTYADIQVAIQAMTKDEQIAAEISKIASSGMIKDKQKLAQAVLDLAKKYGLTKEEAVNALKEIQTETQNQTKEQDKANKKNDEAVLKIKNLSQQRKDDAAASQEEATAVQNLVAELGTQVEVQGMTSKGILQLIQNQDDMANSYGIAADSVGLWWSELEKAQKIEQDERQILLDFAKVHKVDIPDAIKNGSIEQIKTFITEAKNMGDAAEKNAERAAKAFGSLANEAASALEDLIKEDLIKGDIDDVIEKLEEAGTSIDTLSAKQAIIKPILDSTAIDDGLISLTELLDDTWAQATLQAKGGGDEVIGAFNDGLLSQLGELGPPMVEHINGIWQKLKETNPGKTGAELIQMLQAELQNPGPISQAVQSGITNPTINGLTNLAGQTNIFGEQIIGGLATGIESGQGRMATAGEQTTLAMLAPFGPAAQEAFKLAQGISDQAATGLESGAPTMEKAATISIYNPITKKIEEIPTNVPGAIAPIEGMFSTAFLAASNAATDQLAALMVKVRTSMGTMTAQIKFQVNEIITAFQGFNTMNISLDTLNTSISGLDTNLSNLKTNTSGSVDPLKTSLSTLNTDGSKSVNAIAGVIGQLGTTAKTSFSAVDTATGTTSTNIGTDMGAAASSINSFKTATDTGVNAVKTKVGEVDTAMKTIPTSIATNLSTDKMSAAWDGFHTSFAQPTDKTWIQKGTKTIGTDIGAQIKTQSPPWWQGFYNALGTVGAWVGTGLNKIGGAITTAITPTGTAKWWQGFYDALGTTGAWITSGLGKIGSAITTAISPTAAFKWWQGFQNALGTTGTWIATGIGKIGSAITTAISPTAAVKWWQGFQNALGTTGQWISTGLTKIGSAITTAMSPTAALKWWKNFQDALGSTATWVATGIKRIGEGITKTITPTNAFTWWKNFQDALGDTKTWIDTNLTKVGDAIKKWDWGTVGKTIWDTLTAGWGAAIEGLSKSAEGFTGALTGKKAAEDDNPLTKPGRLGSPPQISESAYFPDAAQAKGSTGAIGELITQLYLLDKAVKAVHTTFSSFSTSMSTYMTGMGTAVTTFTTAAGQGFTILGSVVKTTHTMLSTMSTSVTTYMSSMTTAISTFATAAGASLTAFGATTKVVHTALSTMSTSVSTYSSGMTTAITTFATKASASFTTLAASTKTVHTALSSMSTSVSTYSSSMTTAIAGFSTKASASLKTVGTATTTASNAVKTMGSTVTSAMSSMQSKVSSFGSAFSSAMSKVKSQADSATKSVKALQSAVNSLKSKSITVHVGISGPGAAYLRHGGAFISPESTGFAQHGKSWINSKPRKIGGVNVSEFGKPELVTVMPLSNPNSSTDKSMSINLPQIPQVTTPPQMTATTGGGGGSSNQPITVTGNLNIVVKTSSGQVLAKEVQPYLLEGFSGIT